MFYFYISYLVVEVYFLERVIFFGKVVVWDLG